MACKDDPGFGWLLPCGRWPRQIRDFFNKSIEINRLDGYAAILTWLDVVSMVRAAFEGGGAPFPSTRHRFGSPQHG
jgi:hypothetical protein